LRTMGASRTSSTNTTSTLKLNHRRCNRTTTFLRQCISRKPFCLLEKVRGPLMVPPQGFKPPC
jgi:hypothetical protein